MSEFLNDHFAACRYGIEREKIYERGFGTNKWKYLASTMTLRMVTGAQDVNRGNLEIVVNAYRAECEKDRRDRKALDKQL